MIGIVDYGVGNLASVRNAFDAIGAPAELIRDSGGVARAERIVLPGVGAFGEGIAKLRAAGLVDVLRARVLDGGVPFLGICLGMQLLGRVSHEHGLHEGLGWIPGEVRRIAPADPGLPVPHVGWNDVTPRVGGSVLGERALAFYFVHSYHLIPEDSGVVVGTCSYGAEIVAAVQRGHVMGVQFHPEKSQRDGLAVLRRFAAWPAVA
ncbi:MAG TPA: imidazole glycerol phosphate synthase subunit HisH [Myxococcota bacterium]|jgi:glutamine amidotransferase|nr:imidazole glycerol phosphate synthase subunit HisH [Myxococcota bacterium]